MNDTTNTDAATRPSSINKALAMAQGAVFSATRDAKNPFFNSKYATLAEVLGTVREPLAANGFALIQDADTDLAERTVGVVTRLVHESGAELASRRLSAPLKDEFTKDGKPLPPSVQQIGSLVTYLRRYSLCAFLSVAIEDDDGNGVSQIGKGEPPRAIMDARVAAVAAGAKSEPRHDLKSAHTGETLDTPAAVERHKAAAAASKADPAPPRKPNPEPPVEAPRSPNAMPEHAGLREALIRDKISPAELEGYLRGDKGDPRISKPILQGDMTLGSLGERILASMLQPANWDLIRTRIKAVDNVPF